MSTIVLIGVWMKLPKIFFELFTNYKIYIKLNTCIFLKNITLIFHAIMSLKLFILRWCSSNYYYRNETKNWLLKKTPILMIFLLILLIKNDRFRFIFIIFVFRLNNCCLCLPVREDTFSCTIYICDTAAQNSRLPTICNFICTFVSHAILCNNRPWK